MDIKYNINIDINKIGNQFDEEKNSIRLSNIAKSTLVENDPVERNLSNINEFTHIETDKIENLYNNGRITTEELFLNRSETGKEKTGELVLSPMESPKTHNKSFIDKLLITKDENNFIDCPKEEDEIILLRQENSKLKSKITILYEKLRDMEKITKEFNHELILRTETSEKPSANPKKEDDKQIIKLLLRTHIKDKKRLENINELFQYLIECCKDNKLFSKERVKIFFFIKENLGLIKDYLDSLQNETGNFKGENLNNNSKIRENIEENLNEIYQEMSQYLKLYNKLEKYKLENKNLEMNLLKFKQNENFSDEKKLKYLKNKNDQLSKYLIDLNEKINSLQREVSIY